MTTSGSVDFNLTRNEIITMALRKIGAFPRGDSPSSDQISEAATSLNTIVKELQADGVRLWTVDEVQYPLNQASSEVLGTDGKNYRCIRAHVAGTANKPITGGDWSSYWYQDGSSGVAWVAGTTYTCVAEMNTDAQTQFIERAWLRYSNQVDIPVQILNYEQYASISNKWIKGIPLNLFWDKRQNPRMVLWPIPVENTYVLHIHRVRYLQDLDNASDNADIWLPWMNALVYLLAAELSDEYGIELNERNRLTQIAEMKLAKAKRGDRQIVDAGYIAPAYRPERRTSSWR